MLKIEEQRRDQADQGEDRQRGPHHNIALVAGEGAPPALPVLPVSSVLPVSPVLVALH